jgi:hypothetical protein
VAGNPSDTTDRQRDTQPVDDADGRADFHRLVTDVVAPVALARGFVVAMLDDRNDAVLFHAEPLAEFLALHLEVAAGHGDQQVRCIDLWLHRSDDRRSVTAQLEGSDVADWLRLNGHDTLAADASSLDDQATSLRAIARGLALMLD